MSEAALKQVDIDVRESRRCVVQCSSKAWMRACEMRAGCRWQTRVTQYGTGVVQLPVLWLHVLVCVSVWSQWGWRTEEAS